MNMCREYARLLLGKAAEDIYVLERLSADADAPPLDRQWALQCAGDVRAWAESLVAGREPK